MMNSALAAVTVLMIISGVTSAKIRLVSPNGEAGSSSGRLEVFIDGTWGTVCSKHFRKNEAVVACRQLGLDTKSPHHSLMKSADFPQVSPTTPIWLMDIGCRSKDTASIFSCLRGPPGATSKSCTHSKDVLLTCAKKKKRKGLTRVQKVFVGVTIVVVVGFLTCGCCCLLCFTLPCFACCKCSKCCKNKRVAKKAKKADRDMESPDAPLLANEDDDHMLPIPPKKTPPTSDTPVAAATPVQATPTGVPYVPPLPPYTGPPPAPLVTFYAPQDTNVSSGYVPDAPEGSTFDPPHSASAVYPPGPTPSAPPPANPYYTEMLPAQDEKPKEIAILKDPRLHRDLQSSTTALSAIASGIAGLSPRDGSDTAATTSDARRGDEEKGIPVIYPSLNEEGNDGLPLTGTVKTYSSPMAADDDTSQFIAQGTNIPPSSASLDSSRPSREDTYEIGSRAPNLPVAEQGTMRS